MKSEKGFMYLLLSAEVIVLIVVSLLGVVKKVTGPETQTEIETSTQNNQTEIVSQDVEEVPETTPENTETVFPEHIESALEEMSIEEKVAQLFIVSPETLTGADRVTIAGNSTRSALDAYPVGGIVYARSNYLGQIQMRDLLRGAQDMSYEQNGKYLFVGTVVALGEDTVIVNVPVGQEEMLAEVITATDVSANSEIENMEHILYVKSLEELPQDGDSEELYCYSVADGTQAAITAMNDGADMLCVTEDFPTVYEAVLEAVESGEISGDVLKNAVGRILMKKQNLSQ